MAIKVGMVSLGCPKNQVDGEMMLAALSGEGFAITNDASEADVILVNTCGFIDDAKKESIETILEMAEYKKTGRLRALVVTGCLAERYQKEVLDEMPEVDAVLGIGSNGKIAQSIREVLENGEKMTCFPPKSCMPLTGERTLTTPPNTAYLRVADGCSNCCTYCAIPMIRGPFRSRPMEEILEEARKLAKDGVKELVVIAQDTSRYGLDLYDTLMLPELLKQLCQIDGVRWIRVLYAYPDTITPELLEVMAQEPKVCNYLDLPLQHASKDVLKAMNRRGDQKSLLHLVHTLRDKVEDIALRTTLIAGFPGETEEQFAELAEFVKEAQFDHLGCFAYSPEEDTIAAALENQVEDEVKQRRQEIIMEEQSLISSSRLEKQVGKRETVLVEKKGERPGLYVGRTQHQAPEIDGVVLFTAKQPLLPGQFVEVELTGHTDYDLKGHLVSAEQ